jgi:hypothetical protein
VLLAEFREPQEHVLVGDFKGRTGFDLFGNYVLYEIRSITFNLETATFQLSFLIFAIQGRQRALKQQVFSWRG